MGPACSSYYGDDLQVIFCFSRFLYRCYLESSCKEGLSLLSHLFNHLYQWTHGYLFYSLGYNPIHGCLLYGSNGSALAIGKNFRLAPPVSCVPCAHPFSPPIILPEVLIKDGCSRWLYLRMEEAD